VIRAPAQRVWAVLVDPLQSPDWEAGVVAMEDVSGPLDDAGSSCTQIMSFRRATFDAALEVTEADAPRHRTMRTQPPLTRSALRRDVLVETDRGTELTFELSYDRRGGPLGMLLDVTITRPRLAMMLRESLRNLRRLAESD
jgi:uncharacterized protein YndB with AHSA1/START domain